MSEPAPSLLPHEEPLPPRIDLWIAVVFFVVGLAILALCLDMPTYREQQGEIFKAPGVVPGLYGVVIALLSIWLGYRALAAGALRAEANPPQPPREGYSNARLALAAALCVAFSVGLVGWLPFWMAAAVFVFGFTAIFEWRRGMALRERIVRLVSALAIGIGTGVSVMLVFEEIFLVRMP